MNDISQYYNNEESVGKAIRESGIPRSKIFITTKFAAPYHPSAVGALEGSLKKVLYSESITASPLCLFMFATRLLTAGRRLCRPLSHTLSG